MEPDGGITGLGDDVMPAAAAAGPGLASSSATVAVWTVVSRVTGFARAIAIGAALGPTYLGNLFQATNVLPNLTYDFLAGSLFAALLVPPLVRHIDLDDREATARLAGGFLGVVGAAFLAVTVIVVLLGPLILRLFVSGVDDPAVARQQVQVGWPLLVMLMPQVVLYGVAGTGAAVMNAHGRFALAAAAPALENMGVILTMALLAAFHGDTSLAAMHGGPLLFLGLGTTGAVVIHAGAQWLGALRVGVVLRPRVGWRDPEMRELIGRTIPSLGYAALKVLRAFAMLVVANRVAGGVVAFQLALNVYYFVPAVAAQPVAVALLPRLSRDYSQRRLESFRDDLVRAVSLTAFFTVPAALVLVALPGALAHIASVGAMGSAAGRSLVAASLASLGIGVIGDSGMILGTQASYARNDAHAPLVAMVMSVVLSLAVMVLAFFVAHGTAVLILLGLALAAGNLAGSGYLAVRAKADLPTGHERLRSSLLRAFGASALMVAVAAVVVASSTHLLGSGTRGNLVGVIAGGLLGGGAFLVVQRFTRSPELALIRQEWADRRTRRRHPA